MFVSFVVGCPVQFDRRGLEDESALVCAGAEDSEFLVVIGRTALKACNCFEAASELCNKCFERDSRSSVAWFMG